MLVMWASIAALMAAGPIGKAYAYDPRMVEDACSGKNPEGLAALRAAGIGCNGEKLTPDPTAKFGNQAAEAFYELARQRPDFRVTHECQPGGSCQTVETATRAPDRVGRTGKDTFLTYDGSKKRTWCYQDSRDLYRMCFDAADGGEDADGKSWVEAYFPDKHYWSRIELNNPACQDQQQSKYNIDNPYVTCIVAKLDAPEQGAAPAPSNPAQAVAQPVSRNAPLPVTLNEAFRAMLTRNGKRCIAITDHVWVAVNHLSIMCDRRLRAAFLNDGNGWRIGRPGE
jgi:hypothetical protein